MMLSILFKKKNREKVRQMDKKSEKFLEKKNNNKRYKNRLLANGFQTELVAISVAMMLSV